MVEEILVTRESAEAKRKELKKNGWLSAHFWTRHGNNVDKLRQLAKRGELDAKVLNTEGFTTTWYYHELDVAGLKGEANH